MPEDLISIYKILDRLLKDAACRGRYALLQNVSAERGNTDIKGWIKRRVDFGTHRHDTGILQQDSLTWIPLGKQIRLPANWDWFARIGVLGNNVQVNRFAVATVLHDAGRNVIPFGLDFESRRSGQFKKRWPTSRQEDRWNCHVNVVSEKRPATLIAFR